MGHMSSGAATATTAALPHDSRRLTASRRLGVAIVGLIVPLAIVSLGCRGAITPTPTPSASDAAPASIDVSPTPANTEILKFAGTGDKESPEFHASGLSVDVKFDYKCSPDNNFTLNFYGAGVSPELPDVIVDEFGTARSDTVNEPLNNATGPFHLEITTQCEWSVTVLGSK